jgi:hypothetical protein
MNDYSRLGFHRSTMWTAVYNQRRLSMREYDLIADWHATDRGRSVEVAEALAVVATLPAYSRYSGRRMRWQTCRVCSSRARRFSLQRPKSRARTTTASEAL